MLSKRYNNFQKLAVFFIAILCYSCNPTINSFDIQPLTITSEDSVKIKWDISGEPTLLVHEKAVPGDSLSKYLEFTLVVQKGSKETKRIVQVTVLPKESSDLIVFSTILKGDTLVASGDKNSERWGNRFEILTVSSTVARDVTVKHNNKTVEINKDSTSSNELKGTPIEGYWEIRSLLSETEKKDPSTAPESLSLNVRIQYKRR